ncbi:MAG: signal peptidase I [Candidatus Methanomethylicota archaeon]|uniref:Signal peptidase I n=1 Tax=Thermoproteota archaeon TaxID=2056631 RepID=A0A497ESE9_9CREN|nr:MAG: signal peptidase I [Candidatus Verstraetearchaeota archaeon]RLE52795.1 MAG: signal peptidase I [Candidatus Verstraetearchaeota archaeon]
MRKIITLTTFLLILLAIGIGLGACVKAALNTDVPLAAVPTGSMEPTIAKGSLLIIQGIAPKDVKVGDIVVYKLPYARRYTILFVFSYYVPSPIVHRVIAKTVVNGEYYFLTKGDANSIPDQNPLDVNTWLRGEDILGKVLFTIPYIGYFYLWAKTPIGTIVIAAIIVILAASLVFNEAKEKH